MKKTRTTLIDKFTHTWLAILAVEVVLSFVCDPQYVSAVAGVAVFTFTLGLVGIITIDLHGRRAALTAATEEAAEAKQEHHFELAKALMDSLKMLPEVQRWQKEQMGTIAGGPDDWFEYRLTDGGYLSPALWIRSIATGDTFDVNREPDVPVKPCPICDDTEGFDGDGCYCRYDAEPNEP